ncbi:MAG: hypothetical protein ACR2N7_05490 [Acidimicrobiia bacterium]
MTTDTTQVPPDAPEENSTKGPSLVEWLILAACTLGVAAALFAAFQVSDLVLFDAHAMEVVSDAWNSNATIGLIVAIVVAVVVGVFALVLYRATIESDE